MGALGLTSTELTRLCLVDGPRGRRSVPPEHDLEWIKAESASLARELRAAFQKKWAKVIERGLRQTQGGSLEYLGHAVEILRVSGPRRRNRDRIEDLMVAIGRLW
jgi:hypothetical protein